MICPICLIEIPDGSTVCFSCGSSLTQGQGQSQVQLQPQTQYTPPQGVTTPQDYQPYGQDQPYQPYQSPQTSQPARASSYEISSQKPNYYQPTSSGSTNPNAIRRQLESIQKRNQYKTFGIIFLGMGIILLLIGLFLYISIGEWFLCSSSFILIGAGVIIILTNRGKEPTNI